MRGLDNEKYVRVMLHRLEHEFSQALYERLSRMIDSPVNIKRLLNPKGGIPLAWAQETRTSTFPDDTIVSILLEEFIRGGISVFGQIGFGKSIFVLLFVTAAKLLKDLSFLMFDPRGMNFRPLATMFDDTIIVPWQKLSFNILARPKGVDLRSWINDLTYILVELGMVQSDLFLLKLFKRLFEQYEQPTMKDLLDLLDTAKAKDYPGVKPDWIHTAKSVIYRLCATFGDGIFAVDNRMLEYILRPEITAVVESDGLVGYGNTILTKFLTLFLRSDHAVKYRFGEEPAKGIVVDEAGLASMREERDHVLGGASFMVSHANTFQRAYRLPLVFTAQNPSEIAAAFKNNTSATVTFRCVAEEAAKMLSLGDSRSIVSQLDLYQVVVQLKSRFLEPIIGRTFEAPPEMLEKITDVELALLMKDEWSRLEKLTTSTFEPSVAKSSTGTVEDEQATQPTKPQPAKPSATQPTETTEKATNKTKQSTVTKPTEKQTANGIFSKLLPSHHVIADEHRRRPHVNQSRLVQKLSALGANDKMSRQTCLKYLRQMVKMDFFSEVRVSLGPGRPKVFYVPGKLGEVYYKGKHKSILSSKKPRGRGFHLIVLLNTAEKLRQQFHDDKISTGNTKFGKPVGIGELDIVRIHGRELFLYEVDIAANNLTAERVQKMLSIKGVRILTIICEKNRLQKHLTLTELDQRIVVEPLDNWMID